MQGLKYKGQKNKQLSTIHHTEKLNLEQHEPH